MRGLAGRLQREHGVALITVMLVIMLIGIFSAILAANAGQLRLTSDQDRDSKRAFAAGQAALDAGFRHLDANRDVAAPGAIDPTKAPPEIHVECIGIEAAPPQLGKCPAADAVGFDEDRERAGTGTKYEWRVTPVLNGRNCVDPFHTTTAGLMSQINSALTQVASGVTPVGDDPLFMHRCITAVGRTVPPGQDTAVATQRLQQVVSTPVGIVNNIVADDGEENTDDVLIDGGAVISRPATVTAARGVVGTNGIVRVLGNSILHTDVARKPGMGEVIREGSPQGGWFGQYRDRNDPWRLVKVAPGNSRSVNNNATVCLLPGCTYTPGSSGETRTLTIGSGVHVIGPGTYNFCKLTINGSAVVTMAGALVYIDPTSCTIPDAGSMTVSSATLAVADEANPNSVIYVKGSPSNGVGVAISGATAIFTGAIYAPETKIDVSSSATTKGALYARTIHFGGQAQHLVIGGDVKVNLLGATLAEYRGTKWRQCKASPSDQLDATSC